MAEPGDAAKGGVGERAVSGYEQWHGVKKVINLKTGSPGNKRKEKGRRETGVANMTQPTHRHAPAARPMLS